MDIDGVYIFKADSGSTLFSKKTAGIQEDLFSAFLSALKSFFSNFALGGLSSFSSENYIIYLASTNNVLTSLIVDNNKKSDNFFNLAYEISSQFYEDYKSIIDSEKPIFFLPNENQFVARLNELFENFDKRKEEQQEIIKLYQLDSNGDLQLFDFVNEEQLFNLSLFIAVNFVTKQIFIIENAEENISSRKLFFANKSISNLNQREFKSEFEVRNISDPWDFERLIEQISKLLNKESIKI